MIDAPRGAAVARATVGGQVLADHLDLAHTHWSRLKGLLGTTSLPAGHGLWLKPCNQVHMLGMRYAIDVVFLDGEHRVLQTIDGLPPGKISPRVVTASSVLELPAGTLARLPLAAGARVDILAEPVSQDVARGGARSRLGSHVFAVVLVALFVLMVAVHVVFGRGDGTWTAALPMVALQLVLVVSFLRGAGNLRAPTHLFDSPIAMLGTFAPLLFRPGSRIGQFAAVGVILQLLGVVMAVVALQWRVRSFRPACVLANLGYVLTFPGLHNGVIATVALGAFAQRHLAEARS